jgi:hypothetical protein
MELDQFYGPYRYYKFKNVWSTSCILEFNPKIKQRRKEKKEETILSFLFFLFIYIKNKNAACDDLVFSYF